MMGPTHALTGALAWPAAAGLTTTLLHRTQTPVELAIYTAVCAGAALLPDMDCSGKVMTNRGGATVARTFGVFSLFLAECIEKLALAVYLVSHTRKDGKRRNGHRTFTHTWVFAALLGFGVAKLAARFGDPVLIGVLFFTVGLAVRGLMADWARRSGWLLTTLVGVSATILALQVLPEGVDPVLLGASIGVGCLVHTLGDMITRAGCPVLWPVPIAGQLWFEFALPDPIAVRAGGRFETAALRPLLTLALLAAVAWQVPTLRGHLIDFLPRS
ncbi:MAG: metal-dependent hydrolase [Mycobacteriaceae bacterium]|nr:metal-dependent hydrolase [Mycobacteriaceae bacterium]